MIVLTRTGTGTIRRPTRIPIDTVKNLLFDKQVPIDTLEFN